MWWNPKFVYRGCAGPREDTRITQSQPLPQSMLVVMAEMNIYGMPVGSIKSWPHLLINTGIMNKQMTWAHLSLWEGLMDDMGMSDLCWFIHSFSHSANICWVPCVPSTQPRYTKMNQAWLLSSRNSWSRKVNKYIKKHQCRVIKTARNTRKNVVNRKGRDWLCKSLNFQLFKQLVIQQIPLEAQPHAKLSEHWESSASRPRQLLTTRIKFHPMKGPESAHSWRQKVE